MTLLRAYLVPFRGLPRAVWWLALASFVNRSGHMVVPFLAIYATREQGLSMSQAGALLACRGVGSLAGMWIGGVLTDRIGSRRVQLASLWATAVVLSAIPLVGGFVALAVAVAVLGVVMEAFRPALTAAVSLSAGPVERARAFALVRLAANVGWTLGPALGGVLALIDIRLLFAGDALTCVLAALVVVRTTDTPRPARHAGEAEGARAAPPRASPWRDSVLVAGLVLFFLHGVLFFQLISSFPLYATSFAGMTERGVGFLLATNAALVVVLEMQLVHRVGGADPLRLLGFAGLLTGLGYATFPWLEGPFLAVGVVVLTIGEMLSAPFMMTWVSGRCGQQSRGAYLAAMGMSFSSASIVGPWLGTWTLDVHGPRALFLGCLGVGVLILVGYGFLSRIEGAARRSVAEVLPEE